MKRGFMFFVCAVSLVWAQEARATGWTSETSPTTLALRGVAFSSPSTWVAVGDGGTIVRSTDGGVSWTTVSSPVADALRGVSFNGSVGIAVGLGGRVIRSTDSGASWIEETRPTHKNLYSASIDSRMAVITGDEGQIFVSLDNGLTWAPHLAGTASILFGVSVSGDTGVGVGGQGAVVMSPNRGAGWGLTIIGSQLTFFYGVSFVNATTGWLVGADATTGSVIARSDTSGFTWTGQTSPTTNSLFGVSFPTIDVGAAVGANGTIIHTANGGLLWSIQPSGTTQGLNAVSFSSVDLGIAVGDGGTILRTVDGGGTLGPPPVADGKLSGTAALFSKSQTTPGQIDVTYGVTPCSGQKAVILYGALGDFSTYQDCAQSNAGSTGTATLDASTLNNVWFNIVWTDGATGGHPGYASNGTADIERSWNAAGFCALTADDHSDKICN